MTSSHPAIAARAAAVTGALALAVLALPGTAQADPGTIKVHAQGTPFEENANDPKPGCAFYIAAFGVTAGETYRVTFEPQGGGNVAGEPTTASDTYTATQNISKNGKKGAGRSRLFNTDPANLELETGKYKVTAANVNDPGDSKTKVFDVECASDAGGGGGGAGGGDEDGGDVGGVGKPANEDGGAPGIGGVETGGGGATGGDGGAMPLLMLTGAGVAAVALGAKRFRKSG
ncbi:hypothetical protein [Sporichthya sp.]|uniref:hypothetical protein n=1 Tax=Sporichthya sp. TaxID=65475 RepID=UPI001822756C|nr:hypothetical protein [Sporichthya sp.]MBA3744584.1 hypothetical protein [Sporichthya sp.]